MSIFFHSIQGLKDHSIFNITAKVMTSIPLEGSPARAATLGFGQNKSKVQTYFGQLSLLTTSL